MKKSKKRHTKRHSFILASILTILGCHSVYAYTGWQPLADGGWSYLKNDEAVSSGWVTYENEKYYLDETGTLIENQWFSLKSVTKEPKDPVRTSWYYAGEGGRVYRNGWFLVNGYEFYFNSSGAAVRGRVFELDGQKYYINADTGKEHSGWFSVDAADSKGNPYTTWRYANADGTLLLNGWHTVGGKNYYFDANGANYRKRWFTVDDKKYYANEDGTTQEAGWFSVSGVYSSGVPYTNWYYLSEETGQLKGGFYNLEDKTYYFDANGLNYRKRWYVTEEKERYYLEEDGVLQTGGWFQVPTTNTDTNVVTERWYYADSEGKTYRNGIYEIDGKKYYFDVNSTNYRKRWLTDKHARKQYFLEDGSMPQAAWFAISGVNKNGEEYTNWYYADANGYMLAENTYTIEGKEYCFNKNGTMVTGWKRNASGEYTYYGADGAQRYGWQYLEIPAGWINDGVVGNYMKYYGDQAYFYFDPSNSGKLVRSLSNPYREVEISGGKYCVDRYGLMHLGWAKLRTTVPEIIGFGYYMPEAADGLAQGERAANCWVKTMGSNDMAGELSETWYYFDEAGQALRAAKDQLIIKEIQGELFAFDCYGRTQTGFIELEDGPIYYFDKENKNAAVKGVCLADDGSGMAVYQFDSEGKAVNGISDGCLYYRGRRQTASEEMLYEPVKTDSGKIYLVDGEGRVIKAQTVKDGVGGEWVTDENGNIIKSPVSMQPKQAAGAKTLVWNKD